MDGQYTIETLPRGAETGIVVHSIFEHLFTNERPIWQKPSLIDIEVEKRLQNTSLFSWLQPVQELIQRCLRIEFFDGEQTFSLGQLEPKEFFVEMEFIFKKPPNFIKGFIDLIFSHGGKYYLLDWKTNWLKEPSQEAMWKVMDAHDYSLQAALYAEAFRRYLGDASFEKEFGGALYVFVRSGTYLHFQPNLEMVGKNGI